MVKDNGRFLYIFFWFDWNQFTQVQVKHVLNPTYGNRPTWAWHTYQKPVERLQIIQMILDWFEYLWSLDIDGTTVLLLQYLFFKSLFRTFKWYNGHTLKWNPAVFSSIWNHKLRMFLNNKFLQKNIWKIIRLSLYKNWLILIYALLRPGHSCSLALCRAIVIA